jgi:signal transduction histidine kinase
MAVIRRRVRSRPIRSRPIRLFLIGMFAVPLVSVVGLWVFITSITATSAINNHNFSSASRAIGSKGALLSLGLTDERAQTYLWLVAGRTTPDNSVLAARNVVNEALPGAETSLSSGGIPMLPAAASAFHAWFSDLGQLGAIRAAIDSGAMSPLAAFQSYTTIIDAEFHYYYSAIQDPGSTLSQPSIGASDGAYALEMADRETVLADGALADRGLLSVGAQQLFIAAAANRRLLMNDTVTLLPASMSADYASIENSAQYRQFQTMENQITSSIGSGRPIPVNASAWQSASQGYLASMTTAELNSAGQLAAMAASLSDRSLTEALVAGGAGLAAVIGSVLLMAWFGRKLTRDLKGLDGSVRAMAEERLPRVVERLRRGEDVDVLAESPPPPASTIREISQIAASFATVQEEAVAVAVDQARLRKGVSQVFLNISMRNQSLLHRQLAMLDSMERQTSEPGALADLFRLDHLTTRMRRHAEGLIILSGSTPARGWRNPVPVVDVLRAAIAEVEDYVRVEVVSESGDLVAGNAVNDLIHLCAELIENATAFSPPSTRIEIRADRVGNGLAVEIEDRGLGLAEEELADINSRLAGPAEWDLANSEQLGLFVVSMLAARHSITVTLRRSAYGGTTAILLLPFGVMVRAGDPSQPGWRGERRAADDTTGGADDTAGPAALPRGVTGPVPRVSEEHSPSDGAGMPSPSGPSGQHHRLHAAATGRRADTGVTTATGERQRLRAVGEPPSPTERPSPPAPEAPAHQPSAAPPAPRRADAMTSWPQAFQPSAVRREASGHDGQKDTGPGQPLTSPRPSGREPEGPVPGSLGSHLGMPVRVPQANLAPQLRAHPDTDSQTAAQQAADVGQRSPEATRDMLILMQHGWERGRLDDLDEPEGVPDNGAGR